MKTITLKESAGTLDGITLKAPTVGNIEIYDGEELMHTVNLVAWSTDLNDKLADLDKRDEEQAAVLRNEGEYSALNIECKTSIIVVLTNNATDENDLVFHTV